MNSQYATKFDSGEMEKKFVGFYIFQFSGNHTPESILTEREKMRIINTVRQANWG